MSKIIEDLENRFLDSLHSTGQALATQFPQWKISAGYSNPFGTATKTPGHTMGISCSLKNDLHDEPDEVVLEIIVSDIQRQPMIEANVIWGYPGQIEMEVFEKPVSVSEETLDIIDNNFSALVEALTVALRREKPMQKTL